MARGLGRGVKRFVFYMAHPVSAPDADGIKANIARALRWLAWLRRSFTAVTFVAPWVATMLSLDGNDSAELREAGLVDDCATVALLDGIALVGGRVSSGMARELSASDVNGVRTINLTYLGDEQPHDPPSMELIAFVKAGGA